MKRILEYLPILTICFLYFGFCSLYGYYREFKIEIASFVTTQDVVFGFFPIVVVFASTVSAGVFQWFFQDLRHQPNATVDEGKQRRGNWFKKNGFYLIAFYYFPIYLVGIGILKLFKLKPYAMQDFWIFADGFYLMLLYVVISWSDKRDLILRNGGIIAAFVVMFVGFRIQNFRAFDADRVKDNAKERAKKIVFKYDDKNISTSDSVVFVGQISNWLFLYHRKDSSVSAYSMGKISQFEIKP